MTEPLVPNPNIRPPDLTPRSTDDYTPTEGTPVKGQTHPAIKYNTIDDKDYKILIKFLQKRSYLNQSKITKNFEKAV